MHKKAVIYSRVSTNEQTVDNQLKVLREVAEKRGLEVVREISDEGISGATGRDEEKVLMNSLRVLLKTNGTSFLFGMYQD